MRTKFTSRLQYRDAVAHPSSRANSLAQQLLDAQVGYHLERWSEDQLAATVSDLAGDLLAVGERHQIEDLVDREAVKRIVVRAMESMPASAAVSGILELVTAVVVEGPAEPYPLGELVDRDQVEALLDSVLALHPVLERLMEALADVPLVGTDGIALHGPDRPRGGAGQQGRGRQGARAGVAGVVRHQRSLAGDGRCGQAVRGSHRGHHGQGRRLRGTSAQPGRHRNAARSHHPVRGDADLGPVRLGSGWSV